MSCPSEFESNCEFYQVHCQSCRASNGGLPTLKYRPLDSGLPIGSHPSFILTDPKQQAIQSKKGRQANKQGRKAEARLSKDIGAQHNKSSIGFDARHLDLKVEIKYRSKGRPWPTKEEWAKAMATNIDVFIIDSDGDVRVCMPLKTYKMLSSLDS